MTWLVVGFSVWLAIGSVLAVVIGRGISIADDRAPGTGVPRPLTTADLPPSMVARVLPVVNRRRAVPLPPLGIALVALVLALETAGYAARLTGATGTAARMLSMDAPLSLPRLTVAAVFAVAALAAVAGAGVQPGRRTWWLAVAAVAGVIAAVKASGTVHADLIGALSRSVGPGAAVLLSAALAGAVVAWLWLLSRHERRDRRRVLGALFFYGIAVVGLSAVSSLLGQATGGASSWAAAATYLEESGEALAGVAYLLAVLVGVAPRLVLPTEWALRRTGDASSLELPEALPGSGPHLRPR